MRDFCLILFLSSWTTPEALTPVLYYMYILNNMPHLPGCTSISLKSVHTVSRTCGWNCLQQDNVEVQSPSNSKTQTRSTPLALSSRLISNVSPLTDKLLYDSSQGGPTSTSASNLINSIFGITGSTRCGTTVSCIL